MTKLPTFIPLILAQTLSVSAYSQVSGGDIIGFASQAGADGRTTTGGGNAPAEEVRTCSALKSALSSTGSVVVQIPDNTTINCLTEARTVAACEIHCPDYLDNTDKLFYRIPVSGQSCSSLGSDTDSTVNRTRNETVIDVKSDKTLEGLGAGSKVVGANFNLKDVNNIIIRNLNISNVNPGLVEAGDGISMNRTSNIWLDHLSFSDISDGHIDMYESDNVTLSWNRFYGVNSAVCGNRHHYTQIISDSEVTLHHNIWHDISGRNPKIIGADSRVHLFNNFWKNVSYFSIGVGENAEALIEGNYFENARRPHWNTGDGLIDADLNANRYTGVSANDEYRDSGSTVFGDVSLYPYTLESNINQVPNIVNNGSGPK